MRFLLGHNPEIMDKAALNEAFNPFVTLSENNKYYQRWPGHLRSYYGFGWRIHKFWEGSKTNEKNDVAPWGKRQSFPQRDCGVS